MGNCSVGCFCCRCNSTNEHQRMPQHQRMIQHQRILQHQPLLKREDKMNKSDEINSGYHQLPTHDQHNIIEFNDYDDIVNINNDLLLIFGFIRHAQNNLSPDIAHHIIPQSVINLICNYSQKPTLSIFKTRCHFARNLCYGKPSMRIDVKRIACNVKKLFINESSLFFLSTSDHIYVFGYNKKGKLGIGCSGSGTVDQPQTTTFYQKYRFKFISSSSCSTEHSFAVTTNNAVYGYGYNGYDNKRMGVQNSSIKHIYNPRNKFVEELFWPTLLDIKYKIVDIRLGAEHSLFLTNNGRVLGCGSNSSRQLGFAQHDVKGIQLIESLLDYTIVQIRCGRDFSLVLTEHGILKGLGTEDTQSTFRYYTDDSQIIDIKVAEDNGYNHKIITMECGYEHVCCLDENGNVYCWGDNQFGQCSHYGDRQAILLCPHWCRKSPSVTHIACGSHYTVVMDYEMNLYGWGDMCFMEEREEQSLTHVAKYSEFQHLVDGKRIIDIKAGGWGRDLYLCVANH